MELGINKKISLKTRNILNLSKALQCDSFENELFKAMKDCKLETLANTLLVLVETESGEKAFKNIEEVCDFIDEYKATNNKSCLNIFEDLIEEINEAGFFTKKMKKEEMKEKTESAGMEEMIQEAIKKSTANIVESQFAGYKA